MTDQYGSGVSWLATGLTDKQLRSVGLVTLVWNTIEFDLQGLTVSLAGWSPWQGHLVTADMGNINRLQLALNLLNYGYKNQRLIADVRRAITFFDECRKRRNALVHGTPNLDDEGNLSGRLARFDAKHGKGTIKITHIACTNTYLDEMIMDLWLCRMALTDADRKVMRFRRLAEGKPEDLPHDLEREIFEYADPPLDTALVQNRLDHLRSQPPTPSRYPSPAE